MSTLHVWLFKLTSIFLLSLIFLSSSTNNVFADSQFVTTSGTKLYLHGEQYQFTGVNAFNLGTYPGANAGCGHYVENLDGFFSNLRSNSIVRMWAFQGTIATNVESKQIDWRGIDRVVNAAQKNGKKLILVLGNQDGHCDDGKYKDRNWYLSGYKQAFDSGNGLTSIPYIDYVKAIVNRYKDNSAVAMWEPINEPAAGECVNGNGYECYSNLQCGNEAASAAAMKSFFDSVGDTIKGIDANHLISSGALGNGQCGTVYEDYQLVHSSRGIDVGSYHDYDDVDKPIPGDEWNGLQKRINQMAILNKPLYIGEVGMIANGTTCMSLTARRDKMKAKMDAQFAAGIAGFTPWSLTLGNSNGCNYDLISNDPLLTLLREYPVPMSTANPTPSTTPFPVPTNAPDTQPPTVATNLKAANLTPNQVTLNWTAATDNGKVDRYELYRDYSYVTAVWTTNFTDSSLVPGKSYRYYLKTRDGAGNSSAASAHLIVNAPYLTPTPTPTPTPLPTPTPGPDTQPPTAPTSIIPSNLTSSSVTLNWSGATDNVGIDRYELYKDWGYLTAIWGNSYTVNNLTPGKSYLFYLKTRDRAGFTSGESVKLTVGVPYASPTPTPTPTPSPTPAPGPDTQAPTAVTNLTVTAVSPTEVKLNWTAATDNTGVSRYEIYRDYNYITVSYGTSFSHTNLTPGKTYLYYLKTRDIAGNSSGQSMKVSVTTPLQ